HANLRLPLGPLRYLLNSPQMHLWHHARVIPTRTGINFGLTLSVWDWVFGTAHWPDDDADRALGFEGVDTFPSGFVGQLWRPFRVLFQR
ncbi:MAG: sterol desaturase family protein, partial [Myxococcota bacterium]